MEIELFCLKKVKRFINGIADNVKKDLFGKRIKNKTTALEKAFNKYDKDTFEERVERSRYIEKIMPKGYTISGSTESVFILDEAKMTFINGEFIATIILAQAYIERRYQEILDFRGFRKESKKGLSEITRFLRENKLIEEFILNKTDNLRKKRNPFAHLKPMKYEYGIIMRTVNSGEDIYKILENDAKEAMELMYHVSLYGIM